MTSSESVSSESVPDSSRVAPALVTSTPVLDAKKAEAWTILITKFGAERVSKHTWKWHQYKTEQEDEWVPQYKLTTGLDIEGIWTEYDSGISGGLSTREMSSNWKVLWRLDSRTEISRHKKVTDLIDKLSRKPNWNVRLALRFLKDKYPITPNSGDKHLRSVRAFMEHLQKKGTNFEDTIMTASNSYPS